MGAIAFFIIGKGVICLPYRITEKRDLNPQVYFMKIEAPLIARKVERSDVEAYYVPATQMAADMGFPSLANMILLGTVIAKTRCIDPDNLADALHKVIPARKANLFDANMQALQAGMAYQES